MKRLSQVITGEMPPSADVDPHGFDTPQQLAEKEMDELANIVPDILAKVGSLLMIQLLGYHTKYIMVIHK